MVVARVLVKRFSKNFYKNSILLIVAIVIVIVGLFDNDAAEVFASTILHLYYVIIMFRILQDVYPFLLGFYPSEWVGSVYKSIKGFFKRWRDLYNEDKTEGEAVDDVKIEVKSLDFNEDDEDDEF